MNPYKLFGIIILLIFCEEWIKAIIKNYKYHKQRTHLVNDIDVAKRIVDKKEIVSFFEEIKKRSER